MRTLDQNTIFYFSAYIPSMLFLCFINILIYIRYRRSAATVLFHLSFGFLTLSVLCVMLDRAILQLPLELIFVYASRIFFALFLMGLAGVFWAIKRQKKWRSKFLLPPNMELVFSSVDDLAFVVDYGGNVIRINHLQKFRQLFHDENTLSDILSDLRPCFCGEFPDLDAVGKSSESSRYELTIADRDEYYQLVLSPIFSGEISVGYCVLLLDITAIRRSERILLQQNVELTDANEQLANYIKAVGALEAQVQRLHILKNILSGLIDRIERAKEHIQKIQLSAEDPLYRLRIKDIAEELRDIYKEVRASVNQITGEVN